jgi:hypothetical protein
MKLPKDKILLHGVLVDKGHPTKAVITNHYGHTVNSEVPVTGVFQNNHVTYLFDIMEESIDLDYEYTADEFTRDKVQEITNILDGYNHTKDYQNLQELVEELQERYALDYYSGTQWLLGFKRTDDPDLAWYWLSTLGYGYYPDPNAECCAIIGEVYTQVVDSEYVLRGDLCSPCYPGQVDADSEGFYLGYSLPPDYFDEDDPIVKRIRRREDDC